MRGENDARGWAWSRVQAHEELSSPGAVQIPGVENAYCKWGIVMGEEWTVLNGLGEGVTQTARRGRGSTLCAVPSHNKELLGTSCLFKAMAWMSGNDSRSYLCALR